MDGMYVGPDESVAFTTQPNRYLSNTSSGVTAGSYTNANITVNDQGIITAASSGGGGISFGSQDEIPVTNAAGTDFDYDSNFKWVSADAALNVIGGGRFGDSNTPTYDAAMSIYREGDIPDMNFVIDFGVDFYYEAANMTRIRNTSGVDGKELFGQTVSLIDTSGSTGTRLTGTHSQVMSYSSSDYMTGNTSYVGIWGSGTTADLAIAATSDIAVNPGATVTRAIGFQASSTTIFGTIGSYEGFAINLTDIVGSSITDAYGMKFNFSGATVTNSYGIYLDTLIDVGSTLSYAIYSSALSDSYLEGKLGLGTATPATKLDINSGSNSSALRIRGLSESTEIADIYVGASGPLTLDATASTAAAAFIDLRPKDNFYGVIIRESDGTGTSPFANFYVVDAADDYLAIKVSDVQNTDGIVLTASDKMGLGTVPNQKLTVEGTMDLKEQAAANADTAAYGQLWVKDDAPNTLWFTDDTGVDHQLGAGGSPAGSNEELQFNDSGSFGALTGSSVSGNDLELPDRLSLGGSAESNYTLTVKQGSNTYAPYIAAAINSSYWGSFAFHDLGIGAKTWEFFMHGSNYAFDGNARNVFSIYQSRDKSGTAVNKYRMALHDSGNAMFFSGASLQADTIDAQLAAITDSATKKAFVARGAASQTDSIAEFQDSSGTALSLVKSDGNITVPDEAYGAGWNGSTEVPTKNAVYDKIETLGGGGDAITKDVNQTTHGFSVGDIVRHNGTSYTEAQADSVANAEAVGIVSAVDDVDNFTLTMSGYIDTLSSLTAGDAYFLSEATAGLLTATEPTGTGEISKPILITISTTAGYVFNMRGIEIEAGLTLPLAVADGGTGSATASGARTNLGVAIGSDVQAYSAVLDATTASFLTADETKLDGIETAADVTDETNVVAALDGATLSSVTVATDDKVIIQDTSDSDNVKTVTTQSIADLASGGGGELSAKRVAYVVAHRTSTTPDDFGMTLGMTGTRTNPALASTNILTSTQRVNFASPAAASFRGGLTMQNGDGFWRGNAAGLGGFKMVATVGFPQVNATNRVFVGFATGDIGGTMASADVSTITDMVCLGKDSGDTNLQWMVNDATGTATKTDTGIAIDTAELYRVTIEAEANASEISVTLEEIGSGTTDTDTLSSDLPTSTAFMRPQQFVGTGSTATSVHMALVATYVESPR